MSRFGKQFRKALLIFSFSLSIIASAEAAPDILPLEEIRPGMHGVARTVITGTRIEEFGIEVLGIMKNKGAAGDLILVRTYGDVIERSGGIAQGMSGSPVYIGGRLVGAVAYGWSLTDQKTAMVTPIADMLKLWDRMSQPQIAEQPPDTTLNPPAEQPPGQIEPQATPLMAAGFGENALQFLQTKLKRLKLMPYAVGDPPDGVAFGELEPGSAVGLQLIRGDVSLGALGTVTYVEDNKVLAFGHPFLKRGKTSFFMTNAYIYTTIKGIESSFKVGTTGEVIGTVNQDRSAGIAGEMNQYPGVVPIRMNVRDSDYRLTRSAAVQLVQDEEIVPILAAAALLNTIDKSIDRTGPGSARISFEVSARDMPGEVFRRENMFYSPENVSEAAIGEFYEFIAFLAGNQFNAVTIMDVQVDISVSQERRTARILSARPATPTARPGDTVDIDVKLKPYRGEPITRTVSYTVPKNQAAGTLSLTVRGGGIFPLAQLLLKKLAGDIETPKSSRKKQKTFEELIKEFDSRDRNNDIVVEPTDAAATPDVGGEEEFDKKPKTTLSEKSARAKAIPPKPDKPEKPPLKTPVAGGTESLLSKKTSDKNKGSVTTDYIIDADTQINLEIVNETRFK